MTQATRKLTFEEYLNLDAEEWVKRGLPEGRCEYVDGEVVELPSESGLNARIAHYLFLLLVNAGIPFELISLYACEVEVSGKPRSRYPDLTILEEEHLELTQKRLLVRLEMPPPRLVVEVVSPGDTNHKRDYKTKREQYQKRGIPEYWIFDPEDSVVTVCTLIEGLYDAVEFRGSERIVSPTFPDLQLTAEQVFRGGRNQSQ